MKRYFTSTLIGFLINLPILSAYASDFESGYICLKTGDIECAINTWTPLAEQGHVRSQVSLGYMYEMDGSPIQNYSLAASWFIKAAEQGDATAQFKLASKYEDGVGVPQDYSRAFKWYEKAAEQGMPNAFLSLGSMHEKGKGVKKDLIAAAKAYRIAAVLGNDFANFKMGLMYFNGDGLSQDYSSALRYFKKSAEQDYAPAQFYLGVMYHDGYGVPQDDEAALTWFEKGALQGFDSAQYNLGVMHKNDKNTRLATYWFAKSAQQGNKEAQAELVEVVQNLTELTVSLPNLNIHADKTRNSAIVGIAKDGDTLYSLKKAGNWYQVYYTEGHTLGYVAAPLVRESQPKRQQSASPYPSRPAQKAGYVTCNTKCFNGDCYRTYSDGEQIRFQAKRVYEFGEWKWDSGGC